MIPRSWLYVPADDPVRLAKAAGRGADALIIDLEDGVAPNAKPRAREHLADFLTTSTDSGVPALWVRVNSDPELLEEDLVAALRPGLSGIVMAKAESPGLINSVAERLRSSGLGELGLMPLIETGLAVFSVADLASVPGVTHLQVGEADLRADMHITFGPDESELLLVRQRVVIVCAALGLPAPIAPVSVEFRDLDVFRAGTQRLARMGYVGRACIHPAQVAIANEEFTPTAAELEQARQLISQADDAAAAGRGAFVDADGRMVDEAIIRSARRIVNLGTP